MMKKWSVLILAFVFFLSGCSIEDAAKHVSRQVSDWEKDQPPEAFIPKNLNVTSVGDSLTQGVGDSTDSGGYVPYLEKLLESTDGVKDADFHNYGVRGNRTDQLLKKIKTDEVKSSIEKSDVVMITIGGNDVMKIFKQNLSKLKLDVFQQEQIAYQERLKEILDTIREYNPDAGIVLVGLYNPFNTWFSDIEEVKKSLVVGMKEVVKCWMTMIVPCSSRLTICSLMPVTNCCSRIISIRMTMGMSSLQSVCLKG